ncbi:MAG: hypothetical protein ACK5UE_06305 [Chitinophagales bacterium]|jgi:hypothetical protein|nr:hypothetical protein [Sphingobacteriales bacterium]
MINQDFDHPEELDPEEELRMDNKIKRLELEMKGAKFLEHNPEGIQLPPEIEAQMLDQILAFEKVKNEAKEVEIFLYLGRPKIKSAEQLTTEEIILEKERLLKLMSKKGIFLTSIEDVDDKVMYKFITEEFMYKKTLDLPIKGMVRHFVYEEFHPNEQLYAEKTVEFFFQSYFSEDKNASVEILCRDEALDYLNEFKNLYARFELKSYQLLSSNIKKIKGRIQVQIEFEAFIENSLKSHLYSGELSIEVRKRRGHWQITQLRFPLVKNS